ncbi:hypothetical protein [Mesorhizobium sp. LSHC412B00]|uniref:hypothetical protein n=1 Tax=Mesorhizobium sp. LSHC412B00 TaxID=1287285 RepID=UPI0012DD21D1|nr:hypothetical protein [Mesorhizobium sp. LSHC412B00]
MGDQFGRFLLRSAIGTTLPALFLIAGASAANAMDALPVADGAYMRSADLCEQFRKGNVDSIEFSVSKSGHYYEFPESGCVVATVESLRTNRYAVDADCIEGGHHSQASFILDVENPQTLRIDGEQLIACEQQSSSSKPAKSAPLPGIQIVPSGKVIPPKIAKAIPPAKLIRQWEAANENCRGGSGDDPRTLQACDAREALSRQLEADKWCYGKNGQSGYQYKWHRCGKGSNHH